MMPSAEKPGLTLHRWCRRSNVVLRISICQVIVIVTFQQQSWEVKSAQSFDTNDAGAPDFEHLAQAGKSLLHFLLPFLQFQQT